MIDLIVDFYLLEVEYADKWIMARLLNRENWKRYFKEEGVDCDLNEFDSTILDLKNIIDNK